METIRIDCEPNIKIKIVEFLNNFSSKDYKIVTEDASFINDKKKLEATLEKITNGTAEYFSLDELDNYLEKTISKYED
jgi:2C-methyl-D-erythritol 2,4-cyclodiphosphate synthase